MQKIAVLAVNARSKPVRTIIRASYDMVVDLALCEVFNIQEFRSVTMGLLRYYWDGASAGPVNKAAMELVDSGEASPIKGTCWVVGLDADGCVASCPAGQETRAKRAYGRFTRKRGYKNQRSGLDFYRSKVMTAKVAKNGNTLESLTKVASEGWNSMTDEEKRPFLEASQQDEARFLRDKAEWELANPQAPPKPRTAQSLFYEAKGKDTAWASVSDETRAKYQTAAKEGEAKFRALMADYRRRVMKMHVEEPKKQFQAHKEKNRGGDQPTKKKRKTTRTKKGQALSLTENQEAQPNLDQAK